MTLKKQSIRKNISILANNKNITKEELITLSKEWSEKQESFFKKMVKQGGKFKVNGTKFSVKLKAKDDLRSDGTKDGGIVKTPGERLF